MKKFIFLIALLSTILFTHTAFAIEGEGTEESPFLITNQEELSLISDFPACHFKLMNDIELQGEWHSATKFSGVFDGNGNTISNLTISNSINDSSPSYGLFGNNYGIITNLEVITSESGVSAGNFSSGIMCGTNYGTISKCKVSGKLSVSQRNAGSIAGANYGKINNVSANTSIKLSADDTGIGGIVGIAYKSSEISNSYFTGELSGSGYHTSGNTHWCNMGGIVGEGNTSDLLIENCYAVSTYTTSGYCEKQGIVSLYGTVKNCFFEC